MERMGELCRLVGSSATSSRYAQLFVDLAIIAAWTGRLSEASRSRQGDLPTGYRASETLRSGTVALRTWACRALRHQHDLVFTLAAITTIFQGAVERGHTPISGSSCDLGFLYIWMGISS